MDFELPTYKIDQIIHIGQNNGSPPAIENLTLSFPPSIEISEQSFGIQIENDNFQPDFYPGETLIFSKKESGNPLRNVYLFITTDNQTIIGEMIYKPDSKNKTPLEPDKPNTPVYRKARRKNFMTPTPLHIPTSQISPVADPSHERILIRPIGDKKQLISIPLKKSVNAFPMTYIHKTKE